MKLKTTFGVLSIGCSILLMPAQARADFGMPITSPEALNTNAGTDSGADENPQVTTDGDGNWVAVWTSRDSLGSTIGFDSDILVSRSSDNGATWTDAEALNDFANSDSSLDRFPQVTT
ncbi:MAG: exo-alpha-sialidase, partial [Planctomycetes bacterium]|nr:exo-alpha-sialidase [Planctomycetota bacterium]